MNLKLSLKEELKEEFRKIRESKLLVWGILIGIIGSLIAGIINELIKNTTLYPWAYLFILIAVLLILVFEFLQPYLSWKIYLYNMEKWMKEAKKVLGKTKSNSTK